MLNNGYKGAHEDGEKLATMWSKTDTMKYFFKKGYGIVYKQASISLVVSLTQYDVERMDWRTDVVCVDCSGAYGSRNHHQLLQKFYDNARDFHLIDD